MTTARPGPGGRPAGWQQAHARRYIETGGQDGHIWEGVPTLLLTTTGRRSGQPRTTPLIYGRDGDRYLVVASRGGAPTHPDWYQNLLAQPEVQVQVMNEGRERGLLPGLSISSRFVRLYSEAHTKEEDTMGAKGEEYARQLEAKVQEATALLEKLSDADWKKTTAGEKWTVGVTAHHIARSYEPVTHIIKTIAAGQALPHFTPQMLDEMNAQHSKEFAGCTKPETTALLKKGAAAAAAAVRGLSDAELTKSGTVFAGMPPMSAEEMVKRALLDHIDEHFGSVRKAIGG